MTRASTGSEVRARARPRDGRSGAFARGIGLVLAMGSSACGRSVPVPPGGSTREETLVGTRFVEIFEPGADDSAPLIVGLHGLGGSPERFGRMWRDFSGRAEIALAQGPTSFRDGWSWFDWPPELTDDELAVAVGAAEEKLWPSIVALAHGRKVIVTGFSQGAVLSYVIAVRHPEAVAYAFPISGGAPSRLLPRNHAKTAPVYALHGASDEVIGVAYARATIAAFKEDGAVAELHEFPGVGHTSTPEMRDDLMTHVLAVIDTVRPTR